MGPGTRAWPLPQQGGDLDLAFGHGTTSHHRRLLCGWDKEGDVAGDAPLSLPGTRGEPLPTRLGPQGHPRCPHPEDTQVTMPTWQFLSPHHHTAPGLFSGLVIRGQAPC